MGFEIREYLLEKWQRACGYCQAKDIPSEVDHVVAKSSGGTDSITNLIWACRDCNAKKGNRPLAEFLKNKPELLAKIRKQLTAPLKDAAAVNTTRYAIIDALKSFNLPIECATGGRTKYNQNSLEVLDPGLQAGYSLGGVQTPSKQSSSAGGNLIARTQQGYAKAHWIDAACVGESGNRVAIPAILKPLSIKATGRGTRQVCRVDQYGFPRTTAKTQKLVSGFKTGDIVKAIVTKGKKAGTYRGKVAIRSSGYFNIATEKGVIQGINCKNCQLIQRMDGYMYG